MAHLILVRHGETALNAESRYQGRVDPPLSRRGIEQAGRLAHVLARARAKAAPTAGAHQEATWQVHVSPALRCRETASIALPHARTYVDERLAELDFGAYDGRTYEANLAAHGDAFRAWIADPERVRPPGGETLPELQARLGAWLACVQASSDVIAFTHAGPIRATLAHLLGVPFADTWKVDVAPGEALLLPFDGEPADPSAKQDAFHALERLS